MSGILLLLSLCTFMAWTGTNLLFLNTNYNSVLFTVCWITEQWDLIFTASRGFSLLQNMQTDSGDWELSPQRVEMGLEWEGCEVDQSLPVLRLKTCGTKPPIHLPIHHHGMTLNKAQMTTFSQINESHFTFIQNKLKMFQFLDPTLQHCRQQLQQYSIQLILTISSRFTINL